MFGNDPYERYVLHGISAPESPSLITVDDSLRSAPSDHFDMVLTNPPLGRKSYYKVINVQGETEREEMSYLREDSWATTSNKQLNFLQAALDQFAAIAASLGPADTTIA